MRLPHRDPILLGPTPYEVFQESEGIPSVKGFFVEDLMDIEVKSWARMGALGFFAPYLKEYGGSPPEARRTRSVIYSRRSSISIKAAARRPCGSRRVPNRLSSGARERSSRFR